MLKKYLLLVAALQVFASTAMAMDHPVTLVDQGSFMAGGVTVAAPGTYDGSKATNLAGKTMHGDHAYVFYQKPKNAHRYGIVFLHGAGQSGKTWESTPDGRDGFQNIFLEKGYTTYIVDQPRRGRAGQSTVPAVLSATPNDQLWYNTFRIGQWPNVYENAAVPRDAASRDQFLHQMTPDTGARDSKVIADAMVAVFEKAGDNILVTHSAGGGPGWDTAMRSGHVKGIIALEPGAFPFPEGQVPPVEKTTSAFPAAGYAVPEKDLQQLAKIPIVVYFGDNIPKGDKMVANWGQDNWRVRWNLAKRWEEVMKRYGAKVEIVSLPDIGIKGSTHFMMADLNNKDVADAMEQWMKANDLVK